MLRDKWMVANGVVFDKAFGLIFFRFVILVPLGNLKCPNVLQVLNTDFLVILIFWAFLVSLIVNFGNIYNLTECKLR